MRGDLEDVIVAALHHYDGSANVTAIAKFIWENHKTLIERHENALYTWQYDMRWAGQKLQDKGVLKKTRSGWHLC